MSKNDSTAKQMIYGVCKMHFVKLNKKTIYDRAVADPVQIDLLQQIVSQETKKMRLLEKTQMDNLSSMTKAHNEGLAEGLKKGKEEGLAEGLEKGLAEGLEKGIQKGKEEGFAEGKFEEKKQIALNMKNQGLADEFIAKCLNISIDELKNILN